MSLVCHDAFLNEARLMFPSGTTKSESGDNPWKRSLGVGGCGWFSDVWRGLRKRHIRWVCRGRLWRKWKEAKRMSSESGMEDRLNRKTSLPWETSGVKKMKVDSLMACLFFVIVWLYCPHQICTCWCNCYLNKQILYAATYTHLPTLWTSKNFYLHDTISLFWIIFL